MKPRSMTFATSLALLCLPALAEAQYSFQSLGVPEGHTGSTALGVSADGKVVVGQTLKGMTNYAFRWTKATGFTDLGSLGGDSGAQDCSSDGAVITGASGNFAFRWTEQSGMKSLGVLPGGTFTFGNGISGDGTVVTGSGNVPGGFSNAFRWTEATGLLDIGRLPNSKVAITNAVSSDGKAVVGYSGDNSKRTAFRWTQAEGMIALGTLPGETDSEARDVTADGSVVVGESGNQAFRWTKAGGMVAIGKGRALAVTPDGSVIVGNGPTGAAAYWTEQTGWVDLAAELANHGVDMTGWVLYDAWGVSEDGSTIVGSGQYKMQDARGWIATIPGKCYADCDGQSGLDIDDFICFQSAFAQGSIYADCDKSGELDIDDFICYQTQYGIGCN